MPRLKRLLKEFYARDTHIVAQALLGKILVRIDRGEKLTGRIVEVEAYVGEDDLACHASRGRTPRTDIMYGDAGHAYIYLIYGMYCCLNIVTEKKNFPAAVLIRALEPLDGAATMLRRRRSATTLTQTTNGPGKLTQALHITRDLNGIDMTQSHHLWVADDGFRVSANKIAAAPRIGVAYAGTCALYPWRYYSTDSPFVSR
jgi:DNA-3-methyladenine glycosylase